jgi:hypothetical protein
MYIGLHVKYRLFLSDFNETRFFFDSFSKNIQILNVMKIRAVGAELLHADRRTDRHDEANSRSLQYANTPKIDYKVATKGLIRCSIVF